MVVAVVGTLAWTSVRLANERREALIEARRERDKAHDALFARAQGRFRAGERDTHGPTDGVKTVPGHRVRPLLPGAEERGLKAGLQ